MRKFCSFCLLMLIVALLAGAAMPAAAEDVSISVTSGCNTLDAGIPLKSGEQLLETAKAVILYELDSQTLVYAWNPDEQVDPSGMNKIMTALLALELGDPQAVVTVTKDALNSVEIGSVSAGLKAEEQITLKDLLYCMMVGSANDAAAVIAEHIGGDQESFVTLMNQRAQELGCSNTCFMNPTGLSEEGQYSTARDLAKITAAALEIELFTELFSAADYTVSATNKSEEKKIVTTNYLMSKETVRNQYDERVTGGKTGALSTTDRSLICTAESGGSRYLSVVMSAQGTVTANGLAVKRFGSFEETRELLDHGFSGYSLRELLNENQVMEQFSVSGGENDVVVSPEAAVSVMLPNDATELDVTYKCVGLGGGISAPLKQGDPVGTLEVWFRSVCVAQCDLVATHDVYEPGINNIPLQTDAVGNDGSQWETVVLVGIIILLSLIVIAGGCVLAVILIRKGHVMLRHRNRRRNRQRSR